MTSPREAVVSADGWLRRHIAFVAITVAVLFLTAVIAVFVTGGTSTRTIYADFTEAPGLFAGNHVDVLGIPVGTVAGMKAEPGYVRVTMHVDSNLRIPMGASAVLMAPEVVADRFIQLGPTYTSGPTMPNGYVIPLSRTDIPETVDEVFSTLNNLAEQLGPNGANRNGALTALVHQMATSFGQTGPDFRSTVVNFSQALHGLAANSPALASTIENLGALNRALSNNSNTYQSFAANLASVSSILASDRADVSATLSALQQLFASLTSFINSDGAALGSGIHNLDTFVSALASEQQALAQAYSISPLTLENLDNAIDKNAPGGPAIRGRYDPVGSTNGLFGQVCGNTALRFLVILATGTQTNPLTTADSTDTLCAIGNALTALTPPPGASAGPNLSVQALAG